MSLHAFFATYIYFICVRLKYFLQLFVLTHLQYVFYSQNKIQNLIISFCVPLLAIPISTISSGFYTPKNVKSETQAPNWNAFNFLDTCFI